LQQIKKGQKITKIMTVLDEWQIRSNNLLYAMIPKSIAERLKRGDNPINTCEVNTYLVHLMVEVDNEKYNILFT